MMQNKLAGRLERSKDLADIFEVVKDAVRASKGSSRGGLMLGLADLGGGEGHWIGGLYPVASNVIVLNRRPLGMVKVRRPELYKPYVFHILLHEYIHSLGTIDEAETRRTAYEISKENFGEDHLCTVIAKDISGVLPYVTYPGQVPMPEGSSFELVKGFDRSSADSYIN
jgi:hypothetical protein